MRHRGGVESADAPINSVPPRKQAVAHQIVEEPAGGTDGPANGGGDIRDPGTGMILDM